MSILGSLLNPSLNAVVESVNGKTGVVVLNKSDIGLGDANNTSDASKPVSTAQQAALDLKEDLTNKATSFRTVDNTLYPSIQAVQNRVSPTASFYFTQEDAGLGDGSCEMLPIINGDASITGIGGVTNNQVLQSFASLSSDTPITINDGVINVYLQAYKDTGSKDVKLFCKLYKIDNDGSNPILLGTTENSQYLINSLAPIYDGTQKLLMNFNLSEDVAFEATKRVKLEVNALVSGAGTDPEVSLVVLVSDSKLILPTHPNYYLRCTSSATQSIPHLTNTKVIFDVDVVNIGFGSRSSNTIFLPPVAGFWYVDYEVVYRAINTAGSRQAMIIFNGSPSDRRAYNCVGGYTPDDCAISAGSTIYFNGFSDYIEIMLYQTSGLAATVGDNTAPTSRNSFITLKWLGY